MTGGADVGEDGDGPAGRARLASLFGRLTALLSSAGTVWIFVLVLLINADVFGRYLFSRPVTGVPELVSLSIVGIVFLQLGHTLRMERFIRSDVVIGRIIRARPRLGYAIQGLHHAIGAALLAIIFRFAWPKFVSAWANDEYIGAYGVFTVPIWPIWLIILTGTAATTIQFILHVRRDVAVAAGVRPVPALGDHEAVT